MNKLIPLLWSLAALGGACPVSAQSGASIEHTFPTPGELRKPDRTLATTHAALLFSTYSPDGRLFASASAYGGAWVWEARTGEQGTGERLCAIQDTTPQDPVDPTQGLAFSADGKSLVTFAPTGGVKTWNASTGQLIGTVKIATGKVNDAVFRPGSEPLVAAAAGDGVELWNYASGKIVRRFEPAIAYAAKLAFTPDGKRLLAAAYRKIQIWDVETGAALRTIDAPGTHRALAASSTHVAMGGDDGHLTLWSLNGEGAREFKTGSSSVWSVAFGSKGEQLAAVSDEQTVDVWDVASGTLLCRQMGHAARIQSIAFSSNGQKMASGDASGSVNYWTVPLPPIPPGDLEKIVAALPAKATTVPKQPRRLLVFWRADAILHKGGVPAANHAIELLGKKTGAFTADFSRDYAALDPQILAHYDAIVLNSTAHLAIPETAKKALLDYALGGGGVIGIHAAIDTFHGWPEGAAIVGATFAGHPWNPAGTYAVKLDDPDHPLNRAWGGKDFKMHDELYEMGAPYSRSDRRVLLTLDVSDPATANPGSEPLHRKDRDFAIAWIKRAGAGRVFYGGFGHLGEPFQDPRVLQFYLDGIQYALGDLDADATPRQVPPTAK